MQLGALLLQLHLHDLLGVIPGPAGVGHEDRLKQPKEGNRDEVANKKIRLQAGEGEGTKENAEEDVDHPTLGIDGADLHHALAILDGRPLGSVEFDVRFDELYCTIGSTNNCLDGSAGEPENHGTTRDEA